MDYWLLINRSDNTVLCCQTTDPGNISNDRMAVKEWHGRPIPAHNPAMGIESYDPTLGLRPDDPRLTSKSAKTDARIDALAERIASLEAQVTPTPK